MLLRAPLFCAHFVSFRLFVCSSSVARRFLRPTASVKPNVKEPCEQRSTAVATFSELSETKTPTCTRAVACSARALFISVFHHVCIRRVYVGGTLRSSSQDQMSRARTRHYSGDENPDTTKILAYQKIEQHEASPVPQIPTATANVTHLPNRSCPFFFFFAESIFVANLDSIARALALNTSMVLFRHHFFSCSVPPPPQSLSKIAVSGIGQSCWW